MTRAVVTRVGRWSLVGAVLQIATGTLVRVDSGLARRSSAFFRDGAPLFVLSGLVMLLAVVALRGAGAAGSGRPVAAGFTFAVFGGVLFIIGEVMVRFSAAGGNAILGAAEPMTALGMIVVGVAVLRRGLWTGAWRFAPLAVGIDIFVVLLPAFAASSGPNFAAVAGWGVCWAALSWALSRQPSELVEGHRYARSAVR